MGNAQIGCRGAHIRCLVVRVCGVADHVGALPNSGPLSILNTPRSAITRIYCDQPGGLAVLPFSSVIFIACD